MQKLLNIFKMIAVASISFMAITIGILVHSAQKTLADVDKTLIAAHTSIAQTLPLIRESEYVVGKVGEMAYTAQAASLKEMNVLDTVNSRLELTLGHVDDFVVSSRNNEVALLTTTTETVKGVQPVLLSTQHLLEGLQATNKSLNDIASDPAIPKILNDAQQATAASAKTLNNLDDTTSDIKQTVHNYLHPKWWQSTVDWALKVGHALNPL